MQKDHVEEQRLIQKQLDQQRDWDEAARARREGRLVLIIRRDRQRVKFTPTDRGGKMSR